MQAGVMLQKGEAKQKDESKQASESGKEDDGQKYALPKLEKLPDWVGKQARVIALTCFREHKSHGGEAFVAAPAPASTGTSTNTVNIPASALDAAALGVRHRRSTALCVIDLRAFHYSAELCTLL